MNNDLARLTSLFSNTKCIKKELFPVCSLWSFTGQSWTAVKLWPGSCSSRRNSEQSREADLGWWKLKESCQWSVRWKSAHLQAKQLEAYLFVGAAVCSLPLRHHWLMKVSCVCKEEPDWLIGGWLVPWQEVCRWLAQCTTSLSLYDSFLCFNLLNLHFSRFLHFIFYSNQEINFQLSERQHDHSETVPQISAEQKISEIYVF